MDKFLDYPLDPISQHQTPFNSLVYKWLHSADYSMAKYSIPHFADFFRGIKNIAGLLEDLDLPLGIRIYIDRIVQILKEPPLAVLSHTERKQKFSTRQNLYFAYYLRGRYRSNTLELI